MNLLEEQKKNYPEYQVSINNINSILNDLIRRKESNISAKGNPPMPLVNWKLKSYAQTLLHRIIDLTIQSCIAWENNIPAVSFLLTRSVVESVSYIFDFSNQVEPLMKNDNYVEINELTNKLKFGERKISKLPIIDNVLKVMARIDKIIPNYRISYENLSSFCHPNYSAVGMLYSKQDMKEFNFQIDQKYGVRKDLFNIIISFLQSSLDLLRLSLDRFEIIYNEIERLIRYGKK